MASHDLHGVEMYNHLDVDGIHTLLTAIVDYRGERLIGQSIIPGIFNGEFFERKLRYKLRLLTNGTLTSIS